MDTIQAWELVSNRGTHVTLSWIKAHAGHEGNELADTQAKLGASRELINASTLVPWGSVKLAISEAIQQEWNLVRVAPDCNRSYCEDSFSGYSGSV